MTSECSTKTTILSQGPSCHGGPEGPLDSTGRIPTSVALFGPSYRRAHNKSKNYNLTRST